MIKFFIKYRFYISVVVLILDLCSCFFNSLPFNALVNTVLLPLIFWILVCVLHYIVCWHGVANGQSILNWFGKVFFSIILCVISFIKKDSGYTGGALFLTTMFITEAVFLKIFDIKYIE